MSKKSTFPLEKILSVDIKDYVQSQGKGLQNYEMRGVHLIHYTDDNDLEKDNSDPIELFAKSIPIESEVVVNYQIQFNGAGSGAAGEQCMTGDVYFIFNQTGVALIPKKLKSKL